MTHDSPLLGRAEFTPFYEALPGVSARSDHACERIAQVAELKSRGVVFEEYETPELRTVDGIATESGGDRAAWFKDSEGNLLGFVQFS